MIFESPNWTVVRRLGIGDREHVRGKLLSVGCFKSRHLLYTVEAVYKAAVELNMMPRVHINAAREHPVIIEQITRLLHRFAQFDAQLMEHGWLNENQFSSIFETCDLLIEPKSEPNLNIDTCVDELVDLIKFSWVSSGARFLGGNFARLSADELRSIYPLLHPDHNRYHQDFVHANPI